MSITTDRTPLEIQQGPQTKPYLEQGINLLEVNQDKVQPLQSLVINQLILGEGKAVWIDSNNNASTQTMNSLAPSKRYLNKIMVARTFTPYQHYSTVQDLEKQDLENTSIVVLPDLDYHYLGDEVSNEDGEEMVSGVLREAEKLSEKYEIPVLITTRGYEYDTVTRFVDDRIKCNLTDQGPRFVSEEFETLVYQGNGYIQTTLEYWARVLRQQATVTEVAYGTN